MTFRLLFKVKILVENSGIFIKLKSPFTKKCEMSAVQARLISLSVICVISYSYICETGTRSSARLVHAFLRDWCTLTCKTGTRSPARLCTLTYETGARSPARLVQALPRDWCTSTTHINSLVNSFHNKHSLYLKSKIWLNVKLIEICGLDLLKDDINKRHK